MIPENKTEKNSKKKRGDIDQLTPSQIVDELDKYIIGQDNA